MMRQSHKEHNGAEQTSSGAVLCYVWSSAYAVSACRRRAFIALWKGWLPSVIGVIPYVGLNFAVYETLKDSVLKYYGELSYVGIA